MSKVCLRVFAVLLALLLAATTGQAAVADDNEPPILSNFSLLPSSLGHGGGDVTISIDVVDDVGVTGVFASVYLADGGALYADLTATDPDHTNTRSGVVSVPPNFTDEPVSHTVEIAANDTDGATTQEILGSIDVAGQPVFDQAPYVTDGSVEPALLPSDGGTVTIGATVTDDRSVSEAYAVVTDPAGAGATVPLDGVTFSRFEGTWAAPANLGADPQVYGVRVVGLDDIGQQGETTAGEVTVRGRPAEPVSELRVRPRILSFGATRVGVPARKAIVLRNRGESPVPGVVAEPRAPFRLAGRTDGTFDLAPGEVRRFTVVFRPARPGWYQTTLVVRRDDGLQPGLGVALRGVGRAAR